MILSDSITETLREIIEQSIAERPGWKVVLGPLSDRDAMFTVVDTRAEAENALDNCNYHNVQIYRVWLSLHMAEVSCMGWSAARIHDKPITTFSLSDPGFFDKFLAWVEKWKSWSEPYSTTSKSM